MKTCVMLGNGINRCVISNISWGNLLSNIAKKYDVDLNENISFPMQFEIIVNQILQSGKFDNDNAYRKIKEEIIDELKKAELPTNAPHIHLVKNADSILTTNYDYLIECSLDSSFKIDDLPINNTKYNLNHPIEVMGTNIYHIHGDVSSANSICLGYEHYVGNVQNLRNALATKNSKLGNLPTIILVLKGLIESTNIWAEKFFNEDVHIVGFGLTQSEIDIWWLITYRAFLLYANRFDSKKLIRNKIIYYDIGIALNEDMKYTLENLGVEYHFYQIDDRMNDHYLEKYIEIANVIESKINERN